MRLTNLTIEGTNGNAKIRCEAHGAVITVISDLNSGHSMTWKLSATSGCEALWECSRHLQERCDGCTGTAADVNEYYRLLEQFTK